MILKTPLLEKTLIPFLSISFAIISIGLQKEFPFFFAGFKKKSDLHLWPFEWRAKSWARKKAKQWDLSKFKHWICQNSNTGFVKIQTLDLFKNCVTILLFILQPPLSRGEDLLRTVGKSLSLSRSSNSITSFIHWVVYRSNR